MKRSLILVCAVFSLQAMERTKKLCIDSAIKSFEGNPSAKIDNASVVKRELMEHEDIVTLKHSVPILGKFLDFKREAHEGQRGVFLSPSGEYIVVLHKQAGMVEIFHLGCGTKPVAKMHELSALSLAFDSEGERFATAGGEEGSAHVWDSSTGEVLRKVPFESPTVLVRLNANATRLLCITADYTLHIIDLENGQELKQLTNETILLDKALFNHAGEQVVLVTNDHRVLIIDNEEIAISEERHDDQIISLNYNDEQHLVLTTSLDGTARIWQTDGTCAGTLKGHRGPVSCARFSTTTEFVATGSSDGTVKLWNLKGECIRTFEGHTGKVLDVGFNQDSTLLISASADKTACIWDRETGVLLLEIEGATEPVYEAGFIGDKVYTFSEDDTGFIGDYKSVIHCTDRLTARQLLFICSVLNQLKEQGIVSSKGLKETLMHPALGRPQKVYDMRSQKELQQIFSSLPYQIKEVLEPFLWEDISWLAQKKRDFVDCCCGRQRKFDPHRLKS